jgi:hypothetical protein
MSGELKDQWIVSAWVEGIGDIAKFDQCTGGAGQAAEKKYREGGATDQTVLISSKTRTNVEIERIWHTERDGLLLKRLDAARGKELVITKQPADADLNPFGEAIIYRGKLMEVTHPETDSNDESSETKFKLVQSTRNSLG